MKIVIIGNGPATVRALETIATYKAVSSAGANYSPAGLMI